MSAKEGGRTRRYFSGSTEAQALVLAARYHGLAPEEIAFRVFEKQHGFLKSARAVTLVVDPDSPRRAAPAPVAPVASVAPVAPVAPTVPTAPVAPTAPSSRGERPHASAPRGLELPEAAPREAAPAFGTVPVPREALKLSSPARDSRRAGSADSFEAPDEESRLAATVATGRLLRLAGLDLEPTVELGPERLLIELRGADEARLRQLGSEFLNDLDHLLPRMIKGLSGRLVHCRIDGAGVRSAREEELRALALNAARRVSEEGGEVLLEPLPAAERRIVHMALADEPGVGTESFGDGVEKQVRVFPVKK